MKAYCVVTKGCELDCQLGASAAVMKALYQPMIMKEENLNPYGCNVWVGTKIYKKTDTSESDEVSK